MYEDFVYENRDKDPKYLKFKQFRIQTEKSHYSQYTTTESDSDRFQLKGEKAKSTSKRNHSSARIACNALISAVGRLLSHSHTDFSFNLKLKFSFYIPATMQQQRP